MSTDFYKYKLTEKSGGDGEIWIICNDVPGRDNTWEEQPKTGNLLFTSGPVKTDADGHHCLTGHTGSQEVLVLRGAEWSDTKKTGDATLFLMRDTSSEYEWRLVGKTTK